MPPMPLFFLTHLVFPGPELRGFQHRRAHRILGGPHSRFQLGIRGVERPSDRRVARAYDHEPCAFRQRVEKPALMDRDESAALARVKLFSHHDMIISVCFIFRHDLTPVSRHFPSHTAPSSTRRIYCYPEIPYPTVCMSEEASAPFSRCPCRRQIS